MNRTHATGQGSSKVSALFNVFSKNLKYALGGLSLGLFLIGMTATPARSAGPYVELLHLWAVDEEHYALEAFADAVRAMNVNWQEHVATTNFTGIKSILTERLSLGVPPSVVQWIGGREDVLSLYEAGVFRLISRDQYSGLQLDRMLPEIGEIVSHENGYLLLPTGIHLLNHVVYNQMILDEIGEGVPQNWDEFTSAARKAKEAGYYGIAISDERWQLRNLMHGLLVAELTLDEFKNLIVNYDETMIDLTKVEKAFERLRDLQDLSNPNNADLPWGQAVALTAQDRAMASVIGDFSSPLYPDDGHFTCDLPPGNAYYLWAFDTFALTKLDDPNALEGQRALVKAVSDPRNQTTYIIRKGGIPAFEGVDPDDLNKCSQKSMEIWESARQRVFLTSSAWAQNMNVIANAARAFWQSPEMTPKEAATDVSEKLKALNLKDQL